jgi:epoxide hydrolase-like predicted phosphatase
LKSNKVSLTENNSTIFSELSVRRFYLGIQAVIFDFGGVLYHLPDHTWIRRWKGVLNLKDESALMTIISVPHESRLLMDVLVGKLPEVEMWDQFARDFRIGPELMQRIRKGFMSKRRLNKQLVHFLGGLREKYKTAILSNAGSDARKMFTDVYKFQHIVDEMIISAEERVAKPDLRIYEITVDRLDIQPHEALFVDDFQENVEAALNYGMQAILFKNNDQVIDDINCLLQEVG